MNRTETCEALMAELNALGEVTDVEAKSLTSDTHRSVLESVCSFANEPGLGGGAILLGVAEREEAVDDRFWIEGVEDVERAQNDLATQCKTAFSIPVYPRMTVERVDGKAIDNATYRQMSGFDTLRASIELRKLRDDRLIQQKGSGVATYYVPCWKDVSMGDKGLSMLDKGSTMLDSAESMGDKAESMGDKAESMGDKEAVESALKGLKRRMNHNDFCAIIYKLCEIREFTKSELSGILNREESYLKKFLVDMIRRKELLYKYPQMTRHPNQAYRANPDYKEAKHD